MSDESVGSDWAYVPCHRTRAEAEEILLLATQRRRARIVGLLRKSDRSEEEEKELQDHTSTKDRMPHLSRGAAIKVSARIMNRVVTWRRQKGTWCPAGEHRFPFAVVEEEEPEATELVVSAVVHADDEGLATATPATVVEVIESPARPADDVQEEEDGIYEELDAIYGSFTFRVSL